MDLNAIRAKSSFICDMDGVIYHGDRLLPGIPDFVEWLKLNNKKYLFMTNSSARSPRELHQKLKRLGLEVPEDNFYTSALATGIFLKKQKPGASAFVIGEAGLINALYDAGLTVNNVNPDYVVVGESRTYTYETLCTAVSLVRQGASLIGTNPDLTGPVESGIVPATGALMAPIELATGSKAYYVGKPNPLMMRHALKLLNSRREETCIIGDRMDTDIVAGIEAEIETVLVLSGVTTREEVIRYAYRPDCVLEGVGLIPPESEQK